MIKRQNYTIINVHVRVLLYFIIILIVVGCKQDNTYQSDTSLSEGENLYFKDYKAPQYKWGFIDKNGSFAILPRFDDVRDFSNGLALANYKGRWGMINLEDDKVIDFKYRNLQSFSEGLALAEDFDFNKFYIDNKGTKVLDCPYAECYDFHNGLARVVDDNLVTFIDTLAEIRRDMVFSNATDFIEGYSIVAKGGQYGIVNTKGKVIVPLEYDRIKINDGVAMLTQHSETTYIDLSTNAKIGNKYSKGSEFVDGYATVKLGDQYGILSKDGQFKALSVHSLRYLNDQRWAAHTPDGFVIIDTSGQLINNQTYKSVFRYECGVLGVEQSSGWGYIDLDGIEIVPLELPIIWDCSEGYIRFIGRSGYGYMNTQSLIKIAPKYYEARDFKEGLARALKT